jgi:D-aminopeptidase
MSREKSKALLLGAIIFCSLFLHLAEGLPQSRNRDRARSLGVEVGILPVGRWNAITDVPGVKVGHTTLVKGDSVRTGVTVILPHEGNLFLEKVPGAVYVGNGFGKLAGSTQIQELGAIETPIALTNTLSVSTAVRALVEWTCGLEGNERIGSVNAVVGETNDGWLNDIRGFHVQKEDVWEAIESARTGRVPEGNVGAGTGTTCFGFKGGIGTSSRQLPPALGGWTVGVLVQTNFGGVLRINGAPVGRELERYAFRGRLHPDDGSCMIVLATDAPLLHRNLRRLAARAILGLARCGGFCSNGSGDYVIAFSTNTSCRIPYRSESRVQDLQEVRNNGMSALFLAAVESTEEAVYNSMFMAETLRGRNGHEVEALPIQKTIEICGYYNVLEWSRKLPPWNMNSR